MKFKFSVNRETCRGFWSKVKRKLGLLSKIFIMNPVCWIVYSVCGVIYITHVATEYQLDLKTEEFVVKDRTKDNGVAYILCTDSNNFERVFTIESLFRHNPGRSKENYMYLRCQPGRKVGLVYCTEPISKKSYIVDVP